MLSLDLSLFTADDVERLLADVESALRMVIASITGLPRHEIPASRLLHIAELETKRMRYRQRLAELGRPAGDHPADSSSPSGTARSAPSNRNPCVILFLAANPRDTDQLRLGEECAEIHRELQLAPCRDDFRFESRWAVGVDELMRHLQELDPTVIHFSGHGGGNSGLLLQEARGLRQPVSPRGLAMMVRAAALRARMVVLNACYTTVQANALRTTVDCVVGMDGAIGDEAARTFAARLYGALGNRRSVKNAVDSGIAALAGKDLPDEQMPRCLTRDGVDADLVVLTGR